MNSINHFLNALKLAGENEIPTSCLKSLKKHPKNTNPTASGHDLESLKNHIGACKRCPLHNNRTHLVFGQGNPKADLMFVGEGPGRDEDLQGLPFVGLSGKLLTKIIHAMGLDRSEVYIANVVKCRPPNNRNPSLDEIETCSPFLNQQIEIISPKVIVCLGTFSAQTLLVTEEKISKLRGKFHPWPTETYVRKYHSTLTVEKLKLLPTYHPAFLLRNPKMKKQVWEDIQKVMQYLGI